MAVNIRIIEEDFELAEKIKPARVNLKNPEPEANNTRKGMFKLTISIIYFLVLVYSLFKLLA